MQGLTGISYPLARLAGLVAQSLLYGVNVLLNALALYLLITRRSRKFTTRCLTFALFLMFAISTAHFGLITYYAFTDFMNYSLTPATQISIESGAKIWVPLVLQDTNCLLGDLIVMWRVWILWRTKNWAFVLPALLWLSSLAFIILSCMSYQSVDSEHAALVSTKNLAGYNLAYVLTTCLTNVWAVFMIWYKLRIYKKNSLHISKINDRGNTCKEILILLVESGVSYCAVWIVHIALYTSRSNGQFVYLPCIPQLTNMIPTTIIILVCLKITHEDIVEKAPQTDAESQVGTITTNPLTSVLVCQTCLNGGNTTFPTLTGLTTVIPKFPQGGVNSDNCDSPQNWGYPEAVLPRLH